MKYSKEQYDALINEKYNEVQFLEHINERIKKESYSKLFGFCSALSLIATIYFGGVCNGPNGTVSGLLFISSLLYYLKILRGENDILERLNTKKEQLDIFREQRSSLEV